jgi:membrane-associated phospholipid phosphatase
MVNIDKNHKAIITTPNDDWFGIDTISVTVFDPGNLTASTNSVFTVKEEKFYDKQLIEPIKNLLLIAYSDIVGLVKSPFDFKSHDILNITLLIGGTVLLTGVDHSIQTEILKDRSLTKSGLLKFGEFYGSSRAYQISALSLGLYGLAANDDKALRIGIEVFESCLIVENLISVSKRVFGRMRPYAGQGPYKFDPLSFRSNSENALPSGHAALAFSLSSVIAAHTDDLFLKALIFTPAVVTAFSRVYQNLHWASDVFLGGMIGYLIGNYLVDKHNNNNSEKIQIGFDNQGRLGLFWKF